MRLCASFSFGDTMPNLKDFKRMLSTSTLTVTDALDTDCFVETKSTKQITLLHWPQGEQFITYRSDSCLITEKELEEHISKKYPKILKVKKAINIT